MEAVLHGLTGKICLVYLDDIIVFGKNFEGEVQNLKQLFARLKQAGLKMSPKKCRLFQREVGFLGHIVSAQDLEEWRKSQQEDITLTQVKSWKEAETHPDWQDISSARPDLKIYWAQWDSILLIDGILYRKWESTDLKEIRCQLLVPKTRVPQIFALYHDSPTGGHFASNKTLGRICNFYFWPRCRSDVEDWCRRCRICTAKKGPRAKGHSSLQVYNVGALFERIAMDILGPLPPTYSKNEYALVIADYFTKWPEVVPLANQETSTVAQAFVKEFICRHGVLLELHTDQGRNFESTVIKEVTPLHPQSDESENLLIYVKKWYTWTVLLHLRKINLEQSLQDLEHPSRLDL
ncbi:protein NYNRIN-like [Neodiprion pinetum]|uniref:protein NYNRIN-like n=1 Tax=Neodiprion pinetum TaxID=441929 RepID=UPI003722D21D